MTTAYEIPTSQSPQTFNITLAGVVYTLTLKWNATLSPVIEPMGDILISGDGNNPCWLLDIADQSGNAILSGIPLVTGADLLGQFAYLGISGSLVVQSDTMVDAVPDFGSLGSTGHLYFVTEP